MSLFGGDEAQKENQDADVSSSQEVQSISSQKASSSARRDDHLDKDPPEEQVYKAGFAWDSSSGSEYDIEENLERDIDSSQRSRPNKYIGPASTWKSWTEQERMLWSSIKRGRDADLSVHLFNAHALKSRTYLDTDASRTPSPEGKGDWSRRQGSKHVFTPPRGWTAWPLEPDLVPRPDEAMASSGVAGDAKLDSIRKSLYLSAGELEELLSAHTLRKAREKFRAEKKAEINAEEAQADDADVVDEESEGESMPSTASESSQDHYRESSNQLSDSMRSQDSEQSQVSQEEIEESNLDMSLEDDVSYQMLRPSIRHIMSSLEVLLLKLHEIRESQIVKSQDEGSNRETRRRSHRLGGRSETEKKSQLNSQSPIASQDSINSRRSSSTDSMSTDRVKDLNAQGKYSHSPAITRSRSTDYRQLRERVDLRDWSEVLGVASIIGWDSTAIAKTRARVQDLLGEQMEFLAPPPGSSEGEAPERPAYLEQVLGKDQAYRRRVKRRKHLEEQASRADRELED